MRRAKPSEKELVIELLSKAFDSDGSVNFIIPPGTLRSWRIKKLIEYSYYYCSSFGEVFISNDNHSCALVLFPWKRKRTISTMLWDLGLALAVSGPARIQRLVKRENAIRAHYPSGKYCHLWLIGTDPEKQGRGSGSVLLKEILDCFDTVNIPVILQTSADYSLRWYRKFHFELLRQVNLGHTIYLLQRHVKASEKYSSPGSAKRWPFVKDFSKEVY